MTPMSDRIAREESAGIKRSAPQAAAPAPTENYSNEGRTGARPYTPGPTQKEAPEPKPRVNQDAPTQRPSTVSDIAALAKQMQGSQTTAAPAADSPAMQLIKNSMNLDPEAEEAKAIAKRKEALPPEDLSQHDRLIAELERRKQSLEPKEGYEGLMEYLSQVSANSRPGRGSFASGAAGARALDDLNRERQKQQFELSKQAIEVSQKKLDANRRYAEENYNVGKAKFDEVYKGKLAAAKEVVSNEAEATKIAKQETLKYFELAQNQMLEQQKIRAQGAGRPFDVQGEYAKAVLAGDKERTAKLQQILSFVGESKRPGADTAQVSKFKEANSQFMVTLQLLQAKEMKNALKPAEQEQLRKLEAKLSSSAKAQGIEPSQIGIGGVTSSSSGIDLSKWGDLKKN
jgi:hypothetical protein